ncbi:MAG: FAD-dependent 5-carboxymethylaminomethyl-2-thiouridine(34) oxidoreductase MnmC [Cardiobacteriaceae bacterium]|nr:FAD-dependent 5-carboxymethylaminomethyl-2-thiouridine(34) oxidoreductase MnmC [Cardiobacteriaceae bacterium]
MLLEYAELGERDGQPFAQAFADIYYNPADGIAESGHTFLAGNDLFARFATLGRGHFTIAETGFGTGLNFFLTARHFLERVPQGRLTYISVEKYPIAPESLARIQRDFPCPELRAAFLRQNPQNHPGFHLLHLHPQIDLLLLLGDAMALYREVDAQVDAWYLDGFAPAKNPDLWTDALWQEMARLSRAGTTAATFTAARVVRDGLASAGFHVERVPGFGRKRHMLRACCHVPRPAAPVWHDRTPPLADDGPVAVIGAGIAGSATAHRLAASGLRVHLYHDAVRHPPASAVPVAIPYLNPGIVDSPERRYHLTAWHHAWRTLHELARVAPSVFAPCAIHRLAEDDARHEALFAQKLLSDQHWQLDSGMLSDRQSGIVRMPELCAALVDHPQIETFSLALDALPRTAQGWQIGGREYAGVVLACGWQTALLPEAYARDAIRPLRGQGTLFRGLIPDAVYCAEKTLIPLADGVYAGASYQPNDSDTAPRAADRDANAAFVHRLYPQAGLHDARDFTGIRAAARDYLPLVGGIAESAALARDYALWRKDARRAIHATPLYHPGFYLHAGLGSKGATHSFLNADLIAAQLTGSPLPLPRSLLAHLVPARFFIRNLKRGQV